MSLILIARKIGTVREEETNFFRFRSQSETVTQAIFCKDLGEDSVFKRRLLNRGM